jgi:hypothetical protein
VKNLSVPERDGEAPECGWRERRSRGELVEPNSKVYPRIASGQHNGLFQMRNDGKEMCNYATQRRAKTEVIQGIIAIAVENAGH